MNMKLISAQEPRRKTLSADLWKIFYEERENYRYSKQMNERLEREIIEVVTKKGSIEGWLV